MGSPAGRPGDERHLHPLPRGRAAHIGEAGQGGIEPVLWLGPRDKDHFLEALAGREGIVERPATLEVAGWRHPFRLVSRTNSEGETVILGLSDENALELFRFMARTFAEVWVVMVLFGFLITAHNARSILPRVERITETAAQIDHEGLHRRVSEGRGNDEISRLAGTLNATLDLAEAKAGALRLLANLLDNALQHLPHGCRVRVSMRTRGDRVEIDVADDGPGLSKELREQVFERFVKGPGSRGFGVGLALVRAVARANGGATRSSWMTPPKGPSYGSHSPAPKMKQVSCPLECVSI